MGDWLYKTVAGINSAPDAPGYKKIVIKPHPGGKMNDVKASHESPYGAIISEWNIQDNFLTLTVEIPANTTAEVYVPSTGKELEIDGRAAGNPESVTQEGLKFHFLKQNVGSGRYVFKSAFNPGK